MKSRVYLVFMVLAAFCALPLCARIVRVPSVYSYRYHSSDSSGICSHYYEDLLSILEKSCNWELVKVPCKNQETALDMLEKGDLDLAFDFIYDKNLEKKSFVFSDIPCLTNHVFLVTKSSNDRYNGTYLSHLNGARVGYDENSCTCKEKLEDFAKNNDIELNLTAVDYSTGFVDAMIKNSLDLCMISIPIPEISEKIVYSFGMQQLYFISKKPALMAEINTAVKKNMAQDPMFLSRMIGPGKKNAFLMENVNADQVEYIRTHNPIHVSNDDRFYELTKKVDVKKEFWDTVSGLTGFDFIMDNMGSQNVNRAFPCIYEVAEIEKLNPNANKNCFTDAFYSMNVRLICAPGKTIDDFLMHLQYKEKGKRLKPCIAITSEMCKVLPFFYEKFIAFDFVIYSDIDECLQAVSKRECDATLINEIYLQQRYKIDDYRSLRNQNAILMEVPMCVAVTLDKPEILVSILNRAFAQIPYNYYNKLFDAQGIYVQSKPSKEKLRNLIFLFASVSILVLFLYTFAIIMHHTKILQNQINYDSLTGLLSLEGFKREASKLLHFNINCKFLLTELNIRDFSFVNRIYGPEKGDRILVSLAKLLNQFFGYRKNTVIGHGYADSFYVFQKVESSEKDILDGMTSYLNLVQEMIDKVENLHVVLKSGNVITFGEKELHVIISQAGYARRSNHDSLIVNFSVFDENLQLLRENEEFIENNVERALKNNEFVVLFQPKINLQTEKICGAEALVRWKTKNGLVPPDLFIPILEKNGLVGKLDQYVYRCVFRYMESLQNEGLPLVPFSMNISRLNYDIKSFVENLNNMILRYNIPKKYIELEIEERFAGAKDDFIKDFIERLHREDFKVSMDDFGSGSSSLNMLSEIPVDIIKFDQRFLHYAEVSSGSRIVLTSMIKMVKDLGKVTVCEGVESDKHVELLRSVGCSIAQGYYYSKPIDEEEFKKFLIEHY